MARLTWDDTGEKLFELGVDRVVLFVMGDAGTYKTGVAWNGVTSYSENPTGAESNKDYADNQPYLNLLSAEEMENALEAFMYPPEFAPCDGSVEVAPGVYIGQQDRKMFGLCVRTLIGNDTDGQSYGYKLHFLYGANASPSEKTYETVNDSPEAVKFNWDISTTPVPVKNHKPTATLVIESPSADADKLKALEDIVYGTDDTESRLPMPDEIITLMTGTTPPTGD